MELFPSRVHPVWKGTENKNRRVDSLKVYPFFWKPEKIHGIIFFFLNCLRGDVQLVGWLVGCFGIKGPLRQYFSLPERGGKKWEMTDERANVQTTPTRTYSAASVIGPCPTIIQITRTPWHWKFTQHHRSTRPPQGTFGIITEQYPGFPRATRRHV